MSFLSNKKWFVNQVLDFIFSTSSHIFNLSNDEIIILIALSRYHGPKGIYPSTQTLAKELNKDWRNIRRTLDRLCKKSLINIVQNSGKSNNYILTIPDLNLPIINQDIKCTPGVDATPDVHITPGVHATPPLASKVCTPGVDATRSINNKLNKRTRERHARAKSAAPLSLNFVLNDESRTLCQIKNLDEQSMVKKFIDYSLAHDKKYVDAQAAFRLFAGRERINNSLPIIPVISTVAYVATPRCKICDEYNCRCRYTSNEKSIENIRKIKEMLRGTIKSH